MSTIVYRRQDANGDYVAGSSGMGDFLTDLAATAQAIRTWLLLLYGEWWENQNMGFPLWQSILGQGATQGQVDTIIRTQILATPGPPGVIKGISNMTSSLNPSTRTYTFAATVDTTFGAVTVTNIPAGGF